jgi:hypothetical protein
MLTAWPSSIGKVKLAEKDIQNIQTAAQLFVASDGVAGFKDEHEKSWGDYIEECSGVWNHSIKKKDCRKHSRPGAGVWYENGGRFDHKRDLELRTVMHSYLANLMEDQNDG